MPIKAAPASLALAGAPFLCVAADVVLLTLFVPPGTPEPQANAVYVSAFALFCCVYLTPLAGMALGVRGLWRGEPWDRALAGVGLAANALVLVGIAAVSTLLWLAASHS